MRIDVLEQAVVDQSAWNNRVEQFAALTLREAMQLELAAQSLAHHRGEHPAKLGSGDQLLLADSRDQQPPPPCREVGEVADEIEAEGIDVMQVT